MQYLDADEDDATTEKKNCPEHDVNKKTHTKASDICSEKKDTGRIRINFKCCSKLVGYRTKATAGHKGNLGSKI